MPKVIHYELAEDHKGHFLEIEEVDNKGTVRTWRMIEGVSHKDAKRFMDLFETMLEERIDKISEASYGHA